MGMHIGLIAAKVSVNQFREAFARTWPQFETVASASNLADADAVSEWKQSNEKFISAAEWTKENPGRSVYVFSQDGPWALLEDPSYTLAADEESLKSLSKHLGPVLSFVVETAGGCAYFTCFVDGQVRRKISYSEGIVTTEGEPLSEERGIQLTSYYMDETEALWKAFGISPFEAMQKPVGCQAICVIDHTDYSALVRTLPTPPPTEKPWWKFW